jgi:cobyrinic acid a,c-diamide synthase
LVIAGTASGVGKTTIATGLMAALAARGFRVAGFKVGPDYIDPSYHALATGRSPRNLDAFLCGPELIAPLFVHGAAGADIAVIEGVMGLFDGARGRSDYASTAHVAKLLDAPVVLVVDTSAMARSVAAMVHGYATFDPALRVAGVICNRVASPGHAELLRQALLPLGIPLLGTPHRDPALCSPSRHLGLVPVAERPEQARRAVAELGQRLTPALDLDALERIARTAAPVRSAAWTPAGSRTVQDPASRRVAVAGGPAFTFVYTENLELLRAAGAELLPLDPTRDETLPGGTQALYLGGGFPEAHAKALSANTPLRRAVRGFDGPILAECGGLLYLCEELDGLPMCGVLPARGTMTERLVLGYREAEAATGSVLWRRGEQVRGHEFHYSTVTPEAGCRPAWHLDRTEGFVAGRLHASYLHTHWAATPWSAQRFLGAAA